MGPTRWSPTGHLIRYERKCSHRLPLCWCRAFFLKGTDARLRRTRAPGSRPKMSEKEHLFLIWPGSFNDQSGYSNVSGYRVCPFFVMFQRMENWRPHKNKTQREGGKEVGFGLRELCWRVRMFMVYGWGRSSQCEMCQVPVLYKNPPLRNNTIREKRSWNDFSTIKRLRELVERTIAGFLQQCNLYTVDVTKIGHLLLFERCHFKSQHH